MRPALHRPPYQGEATMGIIGTLLVIILIIIILRALF